MTHLAARVVDTLRRRALCAPGARVVAAVSGGADSVALVHLLTELAEAGRVGFVGLAHLNHRLRGAESERDEAFCRQLARNRGVPLDVEVIEVAEIARQSRRSLEDAARAARYAFLERARERLSGEVVAVAHTRDDQAETVLMRLTRGSGLRGMAAIHPRRHHVVRPLIDLRHEELVAYLRARGAEWVEDSSNRDPRFLRTRVRHELLPWLTEHVSPGVVDVLARTADVVADEDVLLQRLADAARHRAEQPDGSVTWALLAADPVAIRRRVVRSIARDRVGREIGLEPVESILCWLDRGRVGKVALSGMDVELSADGRVLLDRGAELAPSPARWRHRLHVPGAIEVPEAGIRFRALPQAWPAADVSSPQALAPGGVVVPASALGDELVVRAWQSGDRLQPLGCSGRKKVQDLFVDRRVPRGERHRVPIVAAADGRIVWVAGHALAEEFAVTPATKSVVVLSFEPLGGL